MNYIKKYWKYIVTLLTGIIIGILINIPSCHKLEPTIEYIPVHDTVEITKERIVEHTNTIFVTDTFIKVDSVYVSKDGTYVELPMTWSEYKDTIKTDSTETKIDIKYHGVLTEIDDINLQHTYNKEIWKIPEPEKPIGLVLFVGPYIGYSFNGNINTGTVGHGPSVGVAVGVGIGIKIKKNNKKQNYEYKKKNYLYQQAGSRDTCLCVASECNTY